LININQGAFYIYVNQSGKRDFRHPA